MKSVLEEYGGLLLAVVASAMMMTVNLSVFLGPIARKIEYIANSVC